VTAQEWRLDLTFGSEDVVTPTRRFVLDTLDEALADHETASLMAVASHELVENAVRYATTLQAQVRLKVERPREGVFVSLTVSNLASAEHIERLRRLFVEFDAQLDPLEYYFGAVRDSAQAPDTASVGLGLPRLRAEGDVALKLAVHGDRVELSAAAWRRYAADRPAGGARSELEKRVHPRTSFGLPVTLMMLGAPAGVPAVLDNVSEGGCFFATSAEVKQGAKVSVVFGVKPQGVCAATGTVVRLEARRGFGVRFDQSNAHMRELVMALACTGPEDRAQVVAGVMDPEIQII
jgi:hypothetical protein